MRENNADYTQSLSFHVFEVNEADDAKNSDINILEGIQNTNTESNDEIQLSRNFKTRHVSMIAIAGAIGTGLIIGSGTALQRGGSVSIFLAYLITGCLLVIILCSLGEMAAFSPMDKAFSGYPARYIDPALGFAAGWNYFFKYAIVFSANLSAVGIIIQYWRKDLNVSIFITTFLVAIVISNWFKVSVYGELEFWSAIIKMVVLLICFITCIVITCGGAPNHETIGFRYWRKDPFVEYLVDGATGRFLGFWACIIQSCFSYVGSEAIGVVFGECPDPKKSIPKISKQVLIRIGFFYIFGIFTLTLAVSPLNPLLASASGSNAAACPFVIAFKTAGIKILPDFINGCLLVFVGSAANTDIYLGSRTLYGLAKDGLAPRIFVKLNKHGVPFNGCLFTALWGLLSYMNASSSSAVIFGYFASAVTVFGILNWMNIMLAYVGYYSATVVQKVSKDQIPFRMWGQPYVGYFALGFTMMLTVFNGYNAFILSFQYKSFITSYIGILIYLIMIVGYKIIIKPLRVTPYTAVLFSNNNHQSKIEYCV